MSQQNVKLLDKYGNEQTFSGIESVVLQTVEDTAAEFFNTADASATPNSLLLGYSAYTASGKIAGNISTYVPGSERAENDTIVIPAANKYCAADIVLPAGGTLPVGTRTLTYKLSDGGSEYIKQYIAPGEYAFAPGAPTPPSGQVFVGWTSEGTICTFPFIPEGNMTLVARFIAPADAVVGATGITRADGALTLTDDAADFEKYTFQKSGACVRVVNRLDEVFPFNEIREVSDSQGNVFIRIPQLYVEWLTTEIDGATVIDGVRFAKTAAQLGQDAFVPSCFRDPDSWGSFLNYVYIGKYEASLGTITSLGPWFISAPGVPVATGTRAYFRDGIRNIYGGKYQQLDWSIYTLYNTLAMVYLQQVNLRDKFYTGRTGGAFAQSYSGSAVTGGTYQIDVVFPLVPGDLTPRTGWNEYGGQLEILGVENPFGNFNKWIDGLCFSGNFIVVFENPRDFRDTAGGVVPYDPRLFGHSRPTSDGFARYLQYGGNEYGGDYRSLVFPTILGGAPNTFSGGKYSYSSQGEVMCAGGAYADSTGASLWCVSTASRSTDSASTIGARLCLRTN